MNLQRPTGSQSKGCWQSVTFFDSIGSKLTLRMNSLRPARSTLFCLMLVSSFSLRGQNLSASKLSAHFINAYTTGGTNIVAGHPQVLKILDLGSGMLQAARAYKAATPSGKVVLRVYTTTSYPMTADPAASATNFWTTVLQPPLNAL